MWFGHGDDIHKMGRNNLAKPIHYRSTTGLNSEFSFFETGYHIKTKESSLP